VESSVLIFHFIKSLTGMCGGFYRQLVWDDLTWRIDILSDSGEARPLSLIANRTPPGLYQSRVETERARECFRRLDSCRDADLSDRIDRSEFAFVLAWIPYQDERLHPGKREPAEKTPTPQQEK
jgi:hypothetical protein